MLEWLYPLMDLWLTDISFAAANSGYINILKWLFKKAPEDQYNDMRRSAERSGRLSVLKWLHKQGFALQNPTAVFIAAIRNGNLKAIEWLYNHGYKGSEECSTAASTGNLPMLQWLRALEFSWGPKVCTVLAENGYLEQLIWAHEHGCLWETQAVYSSALRMNLNVLKYLVNNNCPYDINELAYYAVCGGSLEVLEYVESISPKLSWENDLCGSAVAHGNFQVLQWLLQKGCTLVPCISQAIENGNVELAQWLLDNGCPLDNILVSWDQVFYDENLDMLKWR